MKFKTLEIANFLAISAASVNLDGRGLLLIQGLNEDDSSAESNGAGKSSIADALCWCLYGETARGVSGDAVINRKTGKNTKVSLMIEDGAETYLVERHRKHKTGKNSLQVAQIGVDGCDLTKGTDKLTQDVVNQIIGSSYEVFRASIYAGQEGFPDLPGMTDKNLKTLVEEASGVTVLEKAYAVARADLALTKDGLIKAETDKLRAEEAVTRLADDMIACDHELRTWDLKRTERIKLIVEAARGNAEKARLITVKPVDVETLRISIADLDNAIAAVETEKQEERRLVERDAAEQRNLALARAGYERSRTDAKRKKDALDGLAHKIGCSCGACGRAFTADDILPATEIAKDDLRGALDEMRLHKERLESAQKSAQSAADALGAFRVSMTDLSKTVDQRASLIAELRHIEEMLRDREGLVKLVNDSKARIEELKREENPHLKTRERLSERQEKATTAMRDADTAFRAAEAAAGRAAQVAEVFSPAGVRAHILDTVTPFLNAQTAKYLSVLSDGNIDATWTTLTKTAKGELREKFAIEVASKTGGDGFGSISGGEKRKVRLSTALALQDLVASRAVKPIELFFGDEIDDALDEPGLERLMTILEEKARERGTVMVISHRDLKDWISQVIMVTKRDGASTIEELVE